MRIRRKLLLGAALFGFLALGAPTARAIDQTQLFELEPLDTNAGVPDANAHDGDGAGDDWSNINANSDSALVDTGIIHDEGNVSHTGTPILNDPNIFTGGGSKDVNDLNQWKWKNTGGFPDKNDLTHAYAAAYICPDPPPVDSNTGDDACDAGDLIVFFGADRFDNSGDAFLGFWFFQNTITPVAGSPAGTFSGGGHVARNQNGAGTPGDILLLVNFPQASNAVPLIQALEWVTSGGSESTHLDEIANPASAECSSSTHDPDFCASTNDNSTASPWVYIKKGSTTDGDFPFESFYEGGINLTRLLGAGRVCVSTFLAETRSSESPTATLKDFVLHSFPVCGIEVTKTCSAEIAQVGTNKGDEVDVKFSGTVKNIGAGTVDVELSDNHSDSTIDAVCFDGATGTPDGHCNTTGDTTVSFTGTGTPADPAVFSLDGGETVLYEGSRTVTSPSGLTFTDTVTAVALASGTQTQVASDTADAECTATQTLGLTVTKNCSNPHIEGGDTFKADISGTITNTGNVKLEHLEFSDTDFTDAQFTINGGPGTGNNSGDDIASLAPGASASFTAQVSSTTTTTHDDTLTVAGVSAIDGTPKSGSGTTEDDATQCEVTASPDLSIVKQCNTDFGGGGVQLIEKNGLVVVEVGAVITVTNTGNVDLTSVSVSDPLIADLAEVSGPAFTCTSSGCTGTLQTGATDNQAVFKGTYLPSALPSGGPSDPDATSFNNTASASGLGALDSGSVGPKTDSPDSPCPVCQ